MWFRRKDRSTISRPLGPLSAALVGVLCALGSIGLRAALTPFLGGEERFVAMFPALLLATALGGGVGGFSCLIVGLLGDWFLFLGTPRSFTLAPDEAAGLLALLASGGLIVVGVVVLRSLVQRLQRANEAQRVLTLELQHRVKNNLAVVEALAAQSAGDAADVPGFLNGFLGRLKSLSAAYNLLSRGREDVAEVGQLVAGALAPFDFPGRVSWSGPALGISAEQAVTLALCLHELATNAVKYGALSNDAKGSVRVTWSKPIGKLAQIEWRETGGPPAHVPRQTGLGTRLLRRGLDPARPATINYGPAGLTWSAPFRPSPRRKVARLPS